MEELRRRIENLSPRQRALLSLSIQKQSSGGRNKRLVAYIVPAETETELNTSQLRNYLQSKLPDYMIPSVFVQLESLPRTPNGKIDPQALPDPDTTISASETPLVAPRNSGEKILADIWAEVKIPVARKLKGSYSSVV